MSQEPLEEQSVSILLGDIIQLLSPSEVEIHNKIFLVTYVDKKIIKLNLTYRIMCFIKYIMIK